MRGSGNLLGSRFNLGIRYIPEGVIKRATLRTTLQYALRDDLQIGVEYNPLASDVGPMVNWRVMSETRHRPAFALGSSSDRIGTPSGRAIFGMFSKDIEPYVRVPVSLYGGPMYGFWDDEFVFPFGANVRLGRQWTFTPQFDGHAAHGLLTYSWKRYSVTGMLVRWRHPGIAFNIGF